MGPEARWYHASDTLSSLNRMRAFLFIRTYAKQQVIAIIGE
jgi:hypothetical protein